MESIFEHFPSEKEIRELTNGLEKESYLSLTTPDLLLADIAILYANRGDEKKSAEYWSKIPDLHAEFLLGFDNINQLKRQLVDYG